MKMAYSFDKKIRNNWDNAVIDGITNINRYKANETKLLWILKEPNKENPEEIFSHRNFHKDVSRYTKWQNTYRRIIYVSYGIINKQYKWHDIPDFKENSKIENVNILEDIAIININKSGGSSTSNDSFINKVYIEKKDLLIDQINSINPDVIINASRVYSLFYDLNISSQRINKLNTIKTEYFKRKDRLVINTYHPNCRVKNVTDEVYVGSILKIVKNWKSQIQK